MLYRLTDHMTSIFSEIGDLKYTTLLKTHSVNDKCCMRPDINKVSCGCTTVEDEYLLNVLNGKSVNTSANLTMADRDYAPLTAACVRSLNDKLYEKRKVAALEIERWVDVRSHRIMVLMYCGGWWVVYP